MRPADEIEQTFAKSFSTRTEVRKFEVKVPVTLLTLDNDQIRLALMQWVEWKCPKKCEGASKIEVEVWGTPSDEAAASIKFVGDPE